MAKMKVAPGFGAMSGRLSNVVFAQTQYGTVMRSRPSSKQKRTPAQTQIAINLARANAAWRGLTQEQVDAWQLYCFKLTEENPATGLPLTPQAPHVFLGYATKILQMNELASVPVDPPTTAFYGDVVQCTVESATGAIFIHASTANAPGVTTEILIQKLRQINNKPQSKSYKTAAFQAFTPAILNLKIELLPGSYAIAIRFIDTSTGRKTTIYPLAKAQVS